MLPIHVTHTDTHTQNKWVKIKMYTTFLPVSEKPCEILRGWDFARKIVVRQVPSERGIMLKTNTS